jgi:hypothetical protein
VWLPFGVGAACCLSLVHVSATSDIKGLCWQQCKHAGKVRCAMSVSF